MGWNFLQDNEARQGIHFYDENRSGGWGDAVHRIHDNVIVNQVGPGLDITLSAEAGWNTDLNVDFDNNLLINNGLIDSQGVIYPVVSLQGSFVDSSLAGPNGTINYRHNTIHGSANNLDRGDNVWGLVNAWHLDQGGSQARWTWINNLVDSTLDVPYVFASPFSKPLAEAHHNLWSAAGGALTVPAWDTAPVAGPPRFVDVSAGDLRPAADSPVRATGADLAGAVPRDLLGTARPSPPSIGALDTGSLP